MQSEPGAPAVKGTIPLCVPEICGNEWVYVKECLDTNWVSSVGTFVSRFERELAAEVGTRYAVAVVNGTAALHIALLMADVQPDDEVLVSDLTFIAPANAVRYVGAWPVFIDAEPTYWQMDAQKVQDFVEKECHWHNGALVNGHTGRRIKAILPVHILGHPVDMDPILETAREYDLTVIEDATESLGSKYKGRMVGHLGDIACFSFNGNKLITTGGGGMIVTDNETWAQKAKYLTTQAKDDALEYVHNQIGYNYRLTNVLSAIGCAQLERLAAHVEAKRRIAAEYERRLSTVPGIACMQEAKWAFSVFWMYTALFDANQYGLDSRLLLRQLAQAGIQTRPLWQPMHKSLAFEGCVAYHCDVAEHLNRDALSLPCSVGLTADQQAQVIQMIQKLYQSTGI
jgi:perosamine synthetase